MRSKATFAFTVSLIAVASLARANFYTYTGTTVGAPTYNRTIEDGSALSTVGTATAYNATTFSIDTDGDYFFTSLGVDPVKWDNVLFLYSSFDPTNSLTGYIAGNDDNLGIGSSGFGQSLTAGTYTLVTTGFENGNKGVFVNQILGPGTITPVPEPATIAALGLGALGVMRRRSRQQ